MGQALDCDLICLFVPLPKSMGNEVGSARIWGVKYLKDEWWFAAEWRIAFDS